MSMLAERKIKQKWSLNPRGKAWSEDSSKFGQKMLEKMGWSHGKGLGAKEDGIVEHVKLSYKNDSKGMGYKETNDQWTEHSSNFNALLQSLSGQTGPDDCVRIASLEKKSQNSKVRVHYKKFTRGKDLSRCSEKDLANIFGRKSLKETPPPATKEEEAREETADVSTTTFAHNAGSMVDYFKKKLPNFGKNNGYVIGSNGVLKKESESEEEAYCGFGFKSPDTKKRRSNGEISSGTPKKIKCDDQMGLSNPAFDPLFSKVEVQRHVLNTITEEEGDEIEKKPKKSKIINGGEENANFENNKKKKKKNKENENDESLGNCQAKKKNRNRDISELNGGNTDDSHNTFEVKRKNKKSNTHNSCQTSYQNNVEVQKKRKKSEESNSLAIDNPNFNDDNSQETHNNKRYEVERKKKKKNNKEESLAIDNPNFEEGDAQNSYVNDSYEVRRKKKKDSDAMAIDNPNFDDGDCQNGYVDENYEVKRKKKKKKNKTDDRMAIDNPNFNESLEDDSQTIDENFEIRTSAIDNPSFNDSSEDNQIKKKKKKKKKEKLNDETTIDSITSKAEEKPSVDDTNELNFDLILNITSTPSASKAASSPSKQSSTKKRKSVRFSDVTEERIIPNKEDIENRNELFDINSKVIADGLREANGTPNLGFNSHQVHLEENIDEFSRKLDGFQAEIENDINEAKVTKYIGEVGNPDGENESLPEGTRLKFKYAKFGRAPIWAKKSPQSKSKTSYKHLIKGDIVLGFKNTNLHEIKGYAVENG